MRHSTPSFRRGGSISSGLISAGVRGGVVRHCRMQDRKNRNNGRKKIRAREVLSWEAAMGEYVVYYEEGAGVSAVCSFLPT
jgi:hypothetical protein